MNYTIVTATLAETKHTVIDFLCKKIIKTAAVTERNDCWPKTSIETLLLATSLSLVQSVAKTYWAVRILLHAHHV